MLTLGVDIGGSKLLASVVADGGQPLAEARQETGRATVPSDIVQRVAELVWRFGAEGRAPHAIGIGIPGLCDFSAGVVRSSIMLDGWRDVPLARAVSDATGLPCVVDNDVNAAAACELALRAPSGGSMLFVAVGTGIGGALTFGQEVWRGANGLAGEIGNMVIDRGGPRCWCGRRGCLNTLASGSAIEAAAGIPAGTLASRYAAGELAVLRAVDAAAQALAIGLGNAINLLNPSLVVLGGGVAQLGGLWLDAVRGRLRDEAFAEASSACRVELALAGYEAGARGAALIARESPGAPRAIARSRRGSTRVPRAAGRGSRSAGGTADRTSR